MNFELKIDEYFNLQKSKYEKVPTQPGFLSAQVRKSFSSTGISNLMNRTFDSPNSWLFNMQIKNDDNFSQIQTNAHFSFYNKP